MAARVGSCQTRFLKLGKQIDPSLLDLWFSESPTLPLNLPAGILGDLYNFVPLFVNITCTCLLRQNQPKALLVGGLAVD